METNELSKNARGGTELMMEALYKHVDNDLLSNFQIIPSRVRELKEDKVRILWCHDLPDDPEAKHLANGGWSKFHKIVFVSHWQQQAYINKFGIPWSRTHVLQNAITPFVEGVKSKTFVDIVYHTTPHRGLEILVPVFEKLAETDEKIRLYVYSSFDIYGWKERNKPYEKLFNRIDEHPQMSYHGTQPHETIRNILPGMHIFAYPSIWPETSCMSLMEAMSSRLLCIHPNFAALPETAANFTGMYNFHENPNDHAKIFYEKLKGAVEFVRDNNENLGYHLSAQKNYADTFYSWDMRKEQWTMLLEAMKDLPRGLEKTAGPRFVYEVRGE